MTRRSVLGEPAVCAVGAVLAGLALACLAACSPPVATGNFAAVVRAGQPHEVRVTGTVQQLLADGHGPSGPHERFVLLVDGVRVEVDHNLSLAPWAPVLVGDTITVQGQFEPDPGHPVIHYTHHATGGHEGGYLQVHGRTYASESRAVEPS